MKLTDLFFGSGSKKEPKTIPKFCKDCKFHSPRTAGVPYLDSCSAPQQHDHELSLVDGLSLHTRTSSAGEMRMREDKCGESAKWFEPK